MVTKISSTVIGANALGTAGIGSNVIIARHLANNAVQSRHLGAGANASQVSENVAALQANLSANINVVQDNVAAILDATTDLNIGSGKYFFDKSADSFSIGNTNPAASTFTLGTPANVIINYGVSNNGGNVIIGHGDIGTNTPHRLDVRGTANTGALTATSFIVPNDGDIGSASATDAMQISSGGIVTFKDDILIKDGGTIGAASATGAMTIASTGIVTFVDDILIKDGGTIGSASAAGAITIDAAGKTTTLSTIVTSGLGAVGNTAPASTDFSVGTPANVIVRAMAGKTGNVIIGDPTGTSPHSLDVRGTANVGALTATSLSGPTALTVSDGGTVGSASTTDAITIASDGVVTFKDDIKIKDDGTIGSASAPTAMTIDSGGIVAFVDDIKIKDGGTIGSASAPTAITIDAAGKTTTLSTIVTAGLGAVGNTNPTSTDFSVGTPANVIVRALDGKTGNVIIGNPIGDTSHSLDVRGTANTGALTATSFIVPNDGDIGSTGATDAIQIASDGVVTFKDDIKIKDGGTIGTASDAAAITIAAAGAVTFSDRSVHSAGITVADGGQIGSATTAAALTIAGDGAVTVADDLTITGNLTVSGDTVSQDVTNLTVEDRIILAAKNASGSPSLDTGLMVSRGAQGNVFIGYDESVNKVVVAHTRDPHTNTAISATSAANLDARHVTAESLVLSGDAGVIVPDNGNLGSASATDAMQVSSGGIVTFKDDIKIKDGGTIGSATTAGAITIASDGIVTFVDDIKIKDGGTIGSASATGALTISAAGKTDLLSAAVAAGLGVAGNTAPTTTGISLGTPANVTLRTHAASGAANLIIGDATVTSPFNLDVRGTANVGVLTAKSVVVPNDGDVGSTGATDAIQISSGGIVTFKDDIKVKDDGTIGSASAPTAMTIDSSGIVAFVDDIKIKDGGTIGSASATGAITISAAGKTDLLSSAVAAGLGVAGNTAPTTTGISLGTPANVTLRTHTASGKANLIIGDATVTSPYNLDVRGTANVGALTATSLSGTPALTVSDGGTVGSATTTDAITIAGDGIVTFKDDIKIKDTGTIGTATTAAAITLAADGGATFAAGIAVTGASTVTGRSVVGTGLGIVGNTAPAVSTFSIGQPANAVIRTHDATGAANIIIGDATATSGFNLDVRGSANVGVILTRGVDPLANDHATFVRLNANLNVVQDNVAAASGTTLAPAHNVITTVSGANAYGIGAAVTASQIDRVEVVLSGVRQTRQVGGSDNDFVIPSNGVVQFVEPAANIPAGLRLMIRRWA